VFYTNKPPTPQCTTSSSPLAQSSTHLCPIMTHLHTKCSASCQHVSLQHHVTRPINIKVVWAGKRPAWQHTCCHLQPCKPQDPSHLSPSGNILQGTGTTVTPIWTTPEDLENSRPGNLEPSALAPPSSPSTRGSQDPQPQPIIRRRLSPPSPLRPGGWPRFYRFYSVL
jgi:hypothetical protein